MKYSKSISSFEILNSSKINDINKQDKLNKDNNS